MSKSNARRDRERREAAAARIAAMHEQEQAQKRRQRLIQVSSAVVVVIVVVVVLAVWVATRNSPSVAADTGHTGATAEYGFVVGQKDAPVKLVAYEDFQCPHCEELEQTIGSTIDSFIQKGTISVEYRPVAFLDDESTNDYSTRALNAAVCVSKYGGIADFKKLHDYFYAHQPSEGTAGPGNATLVADAKRVMGKASPAVASCINNEAFKSWTVSATNEFSKVTASMPTGESTPTLLMNGSFLPSSQYLTKKAFIKTIDQAADSESTPTTTPTTTTPSTTTPTTTTPSTTPTTTKGTKSTAKATKTSAPSGKPTAVKSKSPSKG